MFCSADGPAGSAVSSDRVRPVVGGRDAADCSGPRRLCTFARFRGRFRRKLGRLDGGAAFGSTCGGGTNACRGVDRRGDCSIGECGSACALQCAEHGREQLARQMEELDALPLFDDFVDRIDVAERLTCLDSILGVRRQAIGGSSSRNSKEFDGMARFGLRVGVNWDVALRRVNSEWDRMIAASRVAADRDGRSGWHSPRQQTNPRHESHRGRIRGDSSRRSPALQIRFRRRSRIFISRCYFPPARPCATPRRTQTWSWTSRA